MVLEKVRVLYPEHFRDFKPKQLRTLAEMWEELLAPCPANDVLRALKAYASDPGGRYAPRPADLLGIINGYEGGGDGAGRAPLARIRAVATLEANVGELYAEELKVLEAKEKRRIE